MIETSAIMSTLNTNTLIQTFPALHQKVYGKPLIYLDNAATTQKPRAVLRALAHYYEADNANVHRGVHALSERATLAYEQAREKVRLWINAESTKEIIFVRGTTEGINLVAQTYGRAHLKAGSEILVSQLEHHSNIVPWQMLCKQTGASLKVIPMNQNADLDMDVFARMLSSNTKIVALGHVSNALGTVNDIKTMTEMAHEVGAVVVVDGAQALAHRQVDMQDLDCDFYAFSGHKMYGPTGIGVLYGKQALLEAMPPYQGGGEMIASVSFSEGTTYNVLPHKFEAGTPHVAGVIGLGATIDFLAAQGMDAIAQHEAALLQYATDALTHAGVRIIGQAAQKIAVISFVMEGIHPHDIGTIVDRQGIAIRAGHHCAMPALKHFNLNATARISLGLYNTKDDIDALVTALNDVRQIFK